MKVWSVAGKVISVLVILLLGSCSLSMVSTAYWDRKVDELCANHAASEIFQEVHLTYDDYPEMRVQNGIVLLPYEQNSTSTDPYFLRSELVILDEGLFDLEIFRLEQAVVRNSDKELMSSRTSFGRRGGALPIGLGSSGHTCTDSHEQIQIYSQTVKFSEG